MKNFFWVLGLVGALSGSLAFAEGLGRGDGKSVFYTHFAPDPVNVRTGNFYLPTPDYIQTCFGFNLELHRSYNSFSGKLGPFGKGWTHNYEIRVIFDPKAGLSILEADGFLHSYAPLESKSISSTDVMDSIVNAKLEEDRKYTGNPTGKGSAHYKEYRDKLVASQAFFEGQREKYLGSKDLVSKSGKYYSVKRGYSEVYAKPSGYERKYETGQVELFDSRGMLQQFLDRNGNTLSFKYDTKSRLSFVEDQCKQSLQISYDNKDLIDTITDHAQRKMVYAYDDKSQLQYATGLDAKTTEYVYNVKGQMVGIKFNPKSIVTMEYDPKTGRVLSQIGPGKKTTSYTYLKSAGTFTTTVKDNEGENSKYEFMDGENKMAFTDSQGKKTITEFLACCGKTLSIKDEKGVGDVFTYDAQGRLVEIKNAVGQKSTLRYDPRSEKDFTFTLPIEIKDFDQTTKTYKYDSKGNLTYAQSSTGEYAKLSYEEHGKIKSLINQEGISLHFLYDKGRPFVIEKRKADPKTKAEETLSSMTIEYNAFDEVTDAAYKPRLEKTKEDMKLTMINMFRILKPVGMGFEL